MNGVSQRRNAINSGSSARTSNRQISTAARIRATYDHSQPSRTSVGVAISLLFFCPYTIFVTFKIMTYSVSLHYTIGLTGLRRLRLALVRFLPFSDHRRDRTNDWKLLLNDRVNILEFGVAIMTPITFHNCEFVRGHQCAVRAVLGKPTALARAIDRLTARRAWRQMPLRILSVPQGVHLECCHRRNGTDDCLKQACGLIGLLWPSLPYGSAG